MLTTLKKAKPNPIFSMFKRTESAQDVIPVKQVFDDGIFYMDNGTYTQTFRFSDINYATASKQQKENMLLKYCDVINGVPSGQITQIDIVSRALHMEQLNSSLYVSDEADNLKQYKNEMNNFILKQKDIGNGIIQELYFTLSVSKKNEREAQLYFNRAALEIGARFNRMGSVFAPLDLNERLRMLHDIYRMGSGQSFRFDLKEAMKKGHHFKDAIAEPMQLHKDYFNTNYVHGRVLFLENYPNYIKDKLISDLCDIERNMVISVCFLPIPTDEAINEVELKRLGVETNIANFQRRQNANNNFSAVIPYEMEQQRAETREYLDDLTERDQRLVVATVTVIHFADNKEQLDSDTDAIQTVGRNNMCQFTPFVFQQIEGMKTTLPYAVDLVCTDRTLTTESTAAFMPFRAQELYDPEGICYGRNAISNNLLMADRLKLISGNGIISGITGSGKSFICKEEMIQWLFRYGKGVEIILLDPEREWVNPVKSLGGEVININEHHINAFELDKNYDTKNPIRMKNEFIISLCQQAVGLGGHTLTAKERSVIDRCVRLTYKDYIRNGYKGKVPTMIDFAEHLKQQKEPEGESLALALEMWTHGTLSNFAHETDVDIHNNLICFDLLEIGSTLMPVAMLTLIDFVWNRVVKNRTNGIMTYIICDEFYLFFTEEFMAQWFFKLWARARKYNAFMTGILQNVEKMLLNETARTILSNSEFQIMMNQSRSDSKQLASLLKLSDEQLSYVTDAKEGSGLLKFGSAIVPFVNEFPKNTELYKLMSTKPREKF